jgi:hypothetical protein
MALGKGESAFIEEAVWGAVNNMLKLKLIELELVN